MPGKTAVMALLIVCVTVLAFTALVRDSLCELSVRQGGGSEPLPFRRRRLRWSCLQAPNFLWRMAGEEQCTLGKWIPAWHPPPI
ncbi:Hok/Gef family protein [Aeromonas salmonicida]|uniref:Hok/Gef family protein n=1 Tax=Aeromonas salmonicida TaxID=645 RepID=UPI003AFEDE21